MKKKAKQQRLLKKKAKQQKLQAKIENKLSKYYLDVQGLSPGATLDEAYMARILTKIAVGTATVWWSLLELKDFIELKERIRRKKTNGVPGKNSF